MNILKYLLWKSRYGKKCDFPRNSTISKSSFFEGYNKIGEKTRFIDSEMGKASYCGIECELMNTKIGRFTCISNRVHVIRGNHPVDGYVSVHPAFFSQRGQSGICYVREQKREEFKYADAEKKYNVCIGNDVWIGADVRILEGITIGDGAVIAAGAVVCKNVNPYEIVGGVPARHIRYRFEESVIQRLLQIGWWNKQDDWIRERIETFSDIQTFLDNCDKGEK